MRIKSRLIFSLLLLSNFTYGQVVDTVAIKAELELIYDRDQKSRTRNDSFNFISFIDSTNLIRVETLISKYRWPGKNFVGDKGNQTIFLVIQHADLRTQEKYLPLMEHSVAINESQPADLALLRDRILMRQGKKQIYGSQIVRNDSTGGWKFYPIADEKNVNLRRKQMGLLPIEEYAKHFGIKYNCQSCE